MGSWLNEGGSPVDFKKRNKLFNWLGLFKRIVSME